MPDLTIDDVRPLVRSFAVEMERQFRANEHKDGQEWLSLHDPHKVFDRLHDNVLALRNTLMEDPKTPEGLRLIVSQGADVANVVAILVRERVRIDWAPQSMKDHTIIDEEAGAASTKGNDR